MRIAIHHAPGSFSERWIAYCDARGIIYKLVDCYRSDIVDQLADCDALMWHFNHKSPRASKFAKQLLYSLQGTGKKVFPDFNTVWHFDDKIGQKYLLESLGAPLVPTYIFYNKQEAMEWAGKVSYPKVFKLSTGSGSDNVRLVNAERHARNLIRRCFGKGFRQYNAWSNLKERFRKYTLGKTTLWDVIKGIARLVHTTEYSRVTGKEIGYVYFQDYIPGNDHDIRVVVIGDNAFAIKRMVRKGDFRASGSGDILYAKELFDDEIISLSFDLAGKLGTQCVAFDFINDHGKPMIVEISYGFAPSGYDPCPGYWDRDLTWYEGNFDPYGWMIELISL